MFEIIIILLLLLWTVGMLTAFTMGGLIHILLAVALAILLVRLIQRRPI
ncbi:lmo0937 family membrane protein [Chromobacterium sphagni]|nr:lmo0937 family membrane protein [Chromobacterium sphagni]